MAANALFLPVEDPSSIRQIVAWWEVRRIPYNLLVGATGIISLSVFLWLGSPSRSKPDDFVPLLAVIGFGIFANLFYTGGWIVEGLLLAVRRPGARHVGPRLFKAGLIFSFVVTTLPALVVVIERCVKVFRSS